jgi:septal ring factor EnvC (AmiA/AmiB activator)
MKNYEKNSISIKKEEGNYLFFITILLLIPCIIFINTSRGDAADTNISIEQAEDRLQQIEQRKKSIEQELEGLKKEETDYQKSLENIQLLLNEAERELATAKKSYQNTLQEIAKLEEELEIEENKMELQLIILKNRLKKFYKYNNITYLSVLLESKDFSHFLNRFRYLECILKDDAEIVKQVSEQVEFVKKQRDSLENKKEISSLLEREIEKEKENIEISIDAKNKYISKIEQEKKDKLAKLEELEKSSAQIKEIIEIAYQEKEKARQAQQQATQQQPTAATERKEQTLQPRKGIFQLPIKGSIITNYGQQRQEDLNTYVFNSGIDISAPLGEPVRAASFGTVIYIGNVKGYGDIIILDHGGNVVTLYAHLSEILVKMNDQVTKGQIIAQVGTSGGAISPRLHFEVRVEGKPVNPFDWL